MKSNKLKSTTKKKPSKIGRRGRKPGGGILKELKPPRSIFETAVRLAYGKTANDFFGNMARFSRGLPVMIQDLNRRKKQLGEKRIEDAEHVIATDEELISAGTVKDIEAIRYWKDARTLESWTKDARDCLLQEVTEALLVSDASWFKKMAAAIEAEVNAQGQDAYPLHVAILSLFGAPSIHRTMILKAEPINFSSPRENQMPHYAIAELCALLEKQGRRPENQSDEAWQTTVRRARRELSLPILQSKPGPKAQR